MVKITKKLLFKVRKSMQKYPGSVMDRQVVAVCDRSDHNCPHIGEIVTIEEGDVIYTYLINLFSDKYGFVKLFDLEEYCTNHEFVRNQIRQDRQVILAWAHKEPIWESKIFSGRLETLPREEVAFFKRDSSNGHLEWVPIYLRWDDRTEKDLEKARSLYLKNYSIDIFKVEDIDK